METVNDGAESALFKQLFQRWTVKDQTQGLGKVHTRGKVGRYAHNKHRPEVRISSDLKNKKDIFSQFKKNPHFVILVVL